MCGTDLQWNRASFGYKVGKSVQRKITEKTNKEAA